jgi:periplasmic divalent cation tolerance protein
MGSTPTNHYGLKEVIIRMGECLGTHLKGVLIIVPNSTESRVFHSPGDAGRTENIVENHLVMLCAVPDRESGERIGRALVQERLAACVNLLPGMVSTFRWEGEVKQESELLLLIKTVGARVEASTQRIKALHPYEVPEIIALPIADGDPEYLKWLTENSR